MNEKLKKATYRGILEIGNIKIPCFVLEDGTRVISGRGMTTAIGMKGRGQGIRRIPTHKTLKSFIDNELAMAIENPIVFLGYGGQPAHGYEATILVQICEVVLKARDRNVLLTEQEQRYAKACDIITRALAKVGIIALVDEATGYQEVRDRIALQKILDRYLLAEYAKWAKRFPNEFYQLMFQLKGWQWKGMKINRPSVVGHYTNDLVYERLAPGVLEELKRRNPPDEKGIRKTRHHQWLTEDIGHPALQNHLAILVAFMRAAPNWGAFHRNVERALPKVGETIPLAFEEPEQ
jgi:hypothetical protein